MSASQVRCKQALAFFCLATLLVTHRLGMTSEPLAICQSSNRHLRRILDQAAATFFAQRCWHFTVTHGFGHTTLVQQQALWTQLQLQQWTRLQHFLGRNFLPHGSICFGIQESTDLCFFLELWLPSQYSESSVTFVNHTFSQPSGKQEMGGISLESSGNTRKTPSEPHFNGRLYLLAKSFNGVCSKEKGSTGSEFHSFWITRYSYQKLWFPKNRV